MTETQPYVFGDVVDGHRWTVVGWERIEPPEVAVLGPEHGGAVTGDPAAARTVVAAPDLVIELDPRGAAPVVVSGGEPVPRAAASHATGFGDAEPSVPSQASEPHIVNGHRWVDGGWEPVDVTRAAATLPAAWHRPVAATYLVVPTVAIPAPVAGWYPGGTPSS